MKLLLLPILVASVLGVAFVSSFQVRGEASAPQPSGEWRPLYVLDYGETVTLPDGTVLGFVDVVEDSRCPADAMCAWQGRAIVALTIDGERFEVEYLGPDATSIEHDGLVIHLKDVQPYPLASQPSDVSEYEVTLDILEAR